MIVLGVLLSGNGSNLQAILDAIDNGTLDARVALVVSNKPEAYGLVRAQKAGIEAAFVDPSKFDSASSYNAYLAERFTQAGADYLVMAGYMKLLGTEVLDVFPDRVLNIHPSLLPAFAGAHGIKDAFEAGVSVTGVTVHIANEEFDQGEILEQVRVDIHEDDTLESLEERIHKIEHELYPRVLQRLATLTAPMKGSTAMASSAPAPTSIANPRIKRALVSVTDKTGIVEFCSTLISEFGVEIISTGGTAKVLTDAGLDVTPIDEVTEFPEMMDGRVKTLHPRVHGGLLARRGDASHMAQAAAEDIEMIDLVCVNLYAFEATIAREGVTEQEAIENIDIGGPSMLRSAAKNFESVAVVTEPASYDEILSEMRSNQGELTFATRRDLAVAVYKKTSEYDRAIWNYLADQGDLASFDDYVDVRLEKKQSLRYGENPHQSAVLYRNADAQGHTLVDAEQMQGKELSYNNLLDTDSAWLAVREFEAPCCVIVKHTNPCGIATRDELVEAYRAAHESDPISAYGGVMAFNRTVTGELIEAIFTNKQFVEVMIAPDYDERALALLTEKPNVRVLKTGGINPAGTGVELRSIEGGVLAQNPDAVLEDPASFTVVSKRQPTADELDEMLFAWKVAKAVKSNAIVLSKGHATVGVGAGQMNRVNSARIACEEAGEKAKGSVCASDAFMPFSDSLEVVAEAGAIAVIQPGGSIRDKEVIAKADEMGISLVFTGHRHFRH